MSDQGRWFKLWVSASDDPDLTNLSLQDFARWCLFGLYLKVHGRNGRVTVMAPATALCAKFRVTSFDECLKILRSFPNCTTATADVTGGPVTVTVTWRNWKRFQEDNSAARTRRWREKNRSRDGDGDGSVTTGETPKKRRDETRRDLPPTPPEGLDGFEAFWTAYPRKEGRGRAEKAWVKQRPPLLAVLAAIPWQRAHGRLQPAWKDGRSLVPLPASWLNDRGWEDEAPPAPSSDAPPPGLARPVKHRGVWMELEAAQADEARRMRGEA